MVSPYLIHFIVFVAGPLAVSLYFSFSDYDMLTPPQWIGAENYNKLFNEPLFWKSLWNTLYFAILFVPLQTILALVLAVMLNQKLKGLSVEELHGLLTILGDRHLVAVALEVKRHEIGNLTLVFHYKHAGAHLEPRSLGSGLLPWRTSWPETLKMMSSAILVA